MNRIDYSYWSFDDAQIVSGKLALQNALAFDSLNPDELSVEIITGDTGKRKLLTVLEEWYTTTDGRGYVVFTNDIRNFNYGDPVLYYYDGVLQGKFYIRSVDRLSVNRFRLSAYSAAGIMTRITHMGGVYSGESAGDVISEILNLTPLTGWTIAQDVRDVPLYGYLPIASCRDNLQQILFVLGASLMKDGNGNVNIRFLTGNTPVQISDERISYDGTITYKTPATEIVVTEHSYYESSFDPEVSLFDNTDGSGTANNLLVTFTDPCHDLQWNGLAIDSGWDHGANYCYVTGTGVLSGKQYTHTTKVFSVPTGINGEPNISEVKKCALVNPVNSANVAARVRDYKATDQAVSCGIYLEDDNVKPGTLVSFTDPYGDEASGYIETMDITMSGKSKADCTIVKDYEPGHFGNNFTSFDLLTSGNTYTATKTGIIRIVLCQGGQGGQGGSKGVGSSCGTPSSGGSAGKGGNAGKVFVTDINVTTGDTFSYTVGQGGAAGSGQTSRNVPATDGEEGTHSTFGSYTSENGAIPSAGYVNILTGVVYAENGEDGIDGANGGNPGERGGDVTYDGTTWTGGASAPRLGDFSAIGGGGAAYGADGSDADPNTSRSNGTGGRGADAIKRVVLAGLGCGGVGGNGGGGAGAGPYERSICWGSAIGTDGNGSDGNDGGNGFILVFS